MFGCMMEVHVQLHYRSKQGCIMILHSDEKAPALPLPLRSRQHASYSPVHSKFSLGRQLHSLHTPTDKNSAPNLLPTNENLVQEAPLLHCYRRNHSSHHYKFGKDPVIEGAQR